MTSPPIRYRTDSSGRHRPLCQDVRRNAVSYFERAGEPCARYATQRADDGLGILICASHARKYPPTAELVAARTEKRTRLAAVRAEGAARAEASEAKARCPGCGCTPSKRCVLLLPGQRGIGYCAPAGSQLGSPTCSGCLTPELRAKNSDATLWSEREQRVVTSGRADPAGFQSAEVGMCFRVYFTFHASFEAAEGEDYGVEDRRFTRRRLARLFAIGVRKRKGKAEIRYERSRRFDVNDDPSARDWTRGLLVPT